MTKTESIQIQNRTESITEQQAYENQGKFLRLFVQDPILIDAINRNCALQAVEERELVRRSVIDHLIEMGYLSQIEQ